MNDPYVWATDKATGHSYPVLKASVEADQERYQAKPDHPVRDVNGLLLPPKYKRALTELNKTKKESK